MSGVGIPVSVCAALVAVVFATGTAAGGYLGRWPLHASLASAKADLAQLKAAQAETARLQALAAARALQQAQQHGHALTDALAQRQAQIDQLATDKRHALARLTTGRACLVPAAVRVLNSAAEPAPAGLEPVPETPSGAAATGGAFATDADVGHWAATAREQHEICRARLAALIDWHQKEPPHAR